MPNGDHNTTRRGDPRTAREKIADALIPRHNCFWRAAYLLGDDSILLRVLAIPGYDESHYPYYGAAKLADGLPLEGEPHSADLLQFSLPRPR